MAVNIVPKTHPERGAYYEVDMSASGDAFQAHFVPDEGYPRIDWEQQDISWYSTAGVAKTFTNGPPEDLAIDGSGNGVAAGGWQAHAQTAARQNSERDPFTGIRFKATAAGQKVVLWTRSPLRPDHVAEVKGV